MREDYSENSDDWNFFTHGHARSRAYREDGLGGISDDTERLCFGVALWNGKDPILKERLFGLTNSEGNHGEDVKEYYFYLDSTPTHSYMKFLYKYPHGAYPYAELVETNRRRRKRWRLANVVAFARGTPEADHRSTRTDCSLIASDSPVETEMPLYPSLYQINTRVWLTGLAEQLGRPATLDDIPDAELDRLKEIGFDWIWLLSVWQTGPAGQQVSRTNAEWRREFRDTLPDLRDDDIAGSGFAIAGYTVHADLGGDPALARLRQRLRQRGLKLLLDFVPNHMALDHPWVTQHPERFVHGSEDDLARTPQNYCRVKTRDTSVVLAYGRDPYFPGWPDTLQLDYSSPGTQDAMIGELLEIAGQCDGVRCDMAMLVLPDVFERTWGRRAPLFWPRATAQVRERVPEFCFMAEVYWDLEWAMQQQGFDYAYDKRLYDRLREGHARPVRAHLQAGLDYQNKLARFLENHDEPRAAATFPPDVHQAAAVITFLSPGLRFFHQGQFEGRRKRISPHLIRAPQESAQTGLAHFYDRLLGVLRHDVIRNGEWQLLECVPAWDGNLSNDAFVAYAWRNADGARVLVTVNYAPHHSQCYVRLPFAELANRMWRLCDRLGEDRYDRDGNDLLARGLYLDVPPWQAAAFTLTQRD